MELRGGLITGGDVCAKAAACEPKSAATSAKNLNIEDPIAVVPSHLPSSGNVRNGWKADVGAIKVSHSNVDLDKLAGLPVGNAIRGKLLAT